MLYEKLLKDINQNENLELTLRRFELDMLDTMGYGFDYEYDINNNEPIDINSSIALFQKEVLEIKKCNFFR